LVFGLRRLIVGQAAYETARRLYPNNRVNCRDGARIIARSDQNRKAGPNDAFVRLRASSNGHCWRIPAFIGKTALWSRSYRVIRAASGSAAAQSIAIAKNARPPSQV
jgi:hypothetical protein